jgi:hypothetical protein
MVIVLHNRKEYQFAPPVLGRRAKCIRGWPVEYRGLPSAHICLSKNRLTSVLWRIPCYVLHDFSRRLRLIYRVYGNLIKAKNRCILAGPGEEEVGSAGVQPAKQ